MFVPTGNVCFLDASGRWMLFSKASLCLFRGTDAINIISYYWAVFINSYYFVVVAFLFFPLWMNCSGITNSSWVCLSSLQPSSVFCRTGLTKKRVWICFYHEFFFLSPLVVTGSFSGCNSLGWYLWSLWACGTSTQVLSVFRQSTEKAGATLSNGPVFICGFGLFLLQLLISLLCSAHCFDRYVPWGLSFLVLSIQCSLCLLPPCWASL